MATLGASFQKIDKKKKSVYFIMAISSMAQELKPKVAIKSRHSVKP